VSLTLISFISSRTDKKLILLEKQKMDSRQRLYCKLFFSKNLLIFKKKENLKFRPKADSSIFPFDSFASRNKPLFAGAKIKTPFLEGYLCRKHRIYKSCLQLAPNYPLS